MKKMFTLMLCLVMACTLLLTGCGGGTETTATLRIYNWGDYIDDQVLADFRAEHPEINVIYDMFDSNEAMLAKLEGGAEYDILFPSDYMIEKLIAEDMVQELDLDRIEGLENLSPSFMNMAFDPENKYSIPYMWGTVGILYNTTMVKEPVESWDILWDEKYSGQIVMYDSVRDSMGVALKRMGESVNTTDTAKLEAAINSLKEQKPLVMAYMMDNAKSTMINGGAAMAVVYSGDAIFCMGENEELAYAVPKEGSNVWVDGIVITNSCQGENLDAAYTFLSYLCEAEVAKANSEYIGYATPNAAALELMDESVKNDAAYNPPQEVLERCEVYLDLGENEAIYARYWEEFKAN
ncbi:MAG: spermidine/putrescine ABC transporter substrate-binding protein [Clostridiales bacterium]|nr:spermidine/putrescine ABC transporter substrate-binding protein [Clostridiales bacterium]